MSTSLTELIAQGEAVAETKQQPKTRIHGDWQSTETVYAVVDASAFMAWKEAVLDFLSETYGDTSQAYVGFIQQCRHAQYLETLEGIKVLKQLHDLNRNPSTA